jgi:hypothetical protein
MQNNAITLPSISVGRAQHTSPTFTLYARVAAGFVGRLSKPEPSLHLALVIDDGYSITVIDGQPTGLEAGLPNALRIRTNVSTTALPTGVIKTIPLAPPSGMSAGAFAHALTARARSFASYTSLYSFPSGLRGSAMEPDKFNSSSYLAGLLRSVMGRVPVVQVPGYQAPGWESPMPLHFFKGEAIR